MLPKSLLISFSLTEVPSRILLLIDLKVIAMTPTAVRDVTRPVGDEVPNQVRARVRANSSELEILF